MLACCEADDTLKCRAPGSSPTPALSGSAIPHRSSRLRAHRTTVRPPCSAAPAARRSRLRRGTGSPPSAAPVSQLGRRAAARQASAADATLAGALTRRAVHRHRAAAPQTVRPSCRPLRCCPPDGGGPTRWLSGFSRPSPRVSGHSGHWANVGQAGVTRERSGKYRSHGNAASRSTFDYHKK